MRDIAPRWRVARLNVMIARERKRSGRWIIDIDDKGLSSRRDIARARACDGRREEQNAFHARKRCQITFEGAKERMDG